MNKEQLTSFAAGAAPFCDVLVATCKEFGITKLSHQQMFIAQLAHESGSFRSLQENLNYSAQGLVNTWPKRFYIGKAVTGKRNAELYNRNQIKIANAVYSSRMGNGDEASGDGWRFRGRGLKQITGRSNYTACSLALFGDAKILQDAPDRLLEPLQAARSAGWFWQAHKLGSYADKNDFKGMTIAINGGTLGYDDYDRSDLDTRVDWLVRAQRIVISL